MASGSHARALCCAGVGSAAARVPRQSDLARLAYGHFPTDRRRHFIIIGTTNEDVFLRDGTGNHRFWPVEVTEFDLVALRRDRDQLWAEAAEAEAAGESIRLDPKLWGAAGKAQEVRRIEDPWGSAIDEYFGDFYGKIRSADVWKIVGISTEHQNQDYNVRLGQAMRENGWSHCQRRFGGEPLSRVARPDSARLGTEITFCSGSKMSSRGRWVG